MVLMMVVPGLEVAGATPRMVDLAGVAPACTVLRRVVCFPSAEDTSFRIVPAGRPPFACERQKHVWTLRRGARAL